VKDHSGYWSGAAWKYASGGDGRGDSGELSTLG
jgi:hypothetical protein